MPTIAGGATSVTRSGDGVAQAPRSRSGHLTTAFTRERMPLPGPTDAGSFVDPIDLSEFLPLRPAEQALVRAFVEDDIARVGLRRPLMPSPSVVVRGALIARLARSASGLAEQPHRVQIVGAWIEGPLDLRNASVPESLWFFRCVFDASPRFDGARIGGSLSFPGCLLPGLRAEDCTVAGDVALNAGCTVRRDVRLARSTIGRNLNLGRLHLRSGDRTDMQVSHRLVADGARVAGDALLTDGFEADGDVRLVGLRVVGDLRVSSARLSGHVNGEGQRGDALNLDLARVAGNVTLDRGFSAAGAVRLRRAHIDGDLDCSQAAFDAFGDMGWRGAVAFALDRARVGGTLVLAKLKQPLSRATLTDASVGSLDDDTTTWGDGLVLDGFAYRQLAASAPVSSGYRIEWLSRQQPEHMGPDFRAQPWLQLIRVFQRMGLAGAARDVAVARETQLRRVGRIGAHLPRGARWLPRLAHSVFGLLAGYGHRPWRLGVVMGALWLGCAALYDTAASRGAIAPAASWLVTDARAQACRAAAPGIAVDWTRCAALPAEYPAFSALAYSLEHQVPFLDLQQRRMWAVAGERAGGGIWALGARLAAWGQVVFGWLGCLVVLGCAFGALGRQRSET